MSCNHKREETTHCLTIRLAESAVRERVSCDLGPRLLAVASLERFPQPDIVRLVPAPDHRDTRLARFGLARVPAAAARHEHGSQLVLFDVPPSRIKWIQLRSLLLVGSRVGVAKVPCFASAARRLEMPAREALVRGCTRGCYSQVYAQVKALGE